MKPAIRVENLSKRYKIGVRPPGDYQTIREAIVEKTSGALRSIRKGPRRRPASEGGLVTAEAPETFWALKDVNFEIQPGEAVGIIGRNGAGKSTLLKILSQITEPTTGRVELRGRVGSLLEVGTGFHPELTGRENIYLNGAILGMPRREIVRKFDEIVAFAELERFLDTPVKRYSSGMYVRLAFAVAAHLEPEILVVDEVLAVGDAEFQRKCSTKMGDVGREGRTVLLVSHNIAAVEHLCQRCILLNRGEVEADAEASSVVSMYNRLSTAQARSVVDLDEHEGRTPGSIPSMRRVRVGSDRGEIIMGGNLNIAVTFEARQRLEGGITFGVVVKNRLQAPVFGINNLVIPSSELDQPIRRGTVSCRIPNLLLMPGAYYADLYLGTRGHNFDIVLGAFRFDVLTSNVFGSGNLPPALAGDVFCPATWELRDGDGPQS